MDNQRYIPRTFQQHTGGDQGYEPPTGKSVRTVEAPPRLRLLAPPENNEVALPEGVSRFEELSDAATDEVDEENAEPETHSNTDSKGKGKATFAEIFDTQYVARLPPAFVPAPTPETFKDDTIFLPFNKNYVSQRAIDNAMSYLLEQAPGSSNLPADRFATAPRIISKNTLGLPRPPRKLTFTVHKPETGVELPDRDMGSKQFPFKFSLPICELWLDILTNANIRFPRGSIIHPQEPETPAESNYLFGKTICLTILTESNGTDQVEILLAHATWCLDEFEKAQNIYCPDLRRLHASLGGNYIPSIPVFEGPADKEGFIKSHMHAFWMHERVKYNRAKFLKALFDECPSWHGKLNFAVTLALMCIYTEETTVIESLDNVISLSEQVKEDKFSDGAFGRLNRLSDDIFRHFYMKFRRLHRDGPLYKYEKSMKGVDKWLNLIGTVFERDDFVDTLARKTKIEFRQLPPEGLPVGGAQDGEPHEKENVRFPGELKKVVQRTKSLFKRKHKGDTHDIVQNDLMSDGPANPNQLVCCVVFPRGQQDITTELDKDRPWVDQLFWFLAEWYSPGIHAHVSPIILSANNALSTTYAVATGIREMKVWLDEPSPSPLTVPDLSQIFEPVSHLASPAISHKSSVTSIATIPPPEAATYTVRAQHMEAHIVEGLHAVPEPGGEPYPHSIAFVARDGIPLPDPLLLRLHRAVSMAATCSGAWAAGDEVMAAEKPVWCRWCRVDFAHYCLPGIMRFPPERLSTNDKPEGSGIHL
ncbi:hypothetical protein TWF696_003034 [Orbilia brochopaga]|uniref:Uncharacterized protein n=1 Tax=Orbilia brochopaga TaxID=3140254 RepID=A0AAV9TZF5_9PEZI